MSYMELPTLTATTSAAASAQLKRSCGGGLGLGYGSSTSMEIRWASSAGKRRLFKSSSSSSCSVPIYISTNPSHVNPESLRELYSTCNHSCYPLFPPRPKLHHTHTHTHTRAENEEEEEQAVVDVKKLGIALAHSSVVVSVFCNPHDLPSCPSTSSSTSTCNFCDNQEAKQEEEDHSTPPPSTVGLGDLFRRVMPLPLPLPLPLPPPSPSSGLLVGFGRAVSDLGLTASIHDVMVMPSMRGMGIGKMIVKRIVRILTNREIYDISALCSADERSFFKACGFSEDMLGSTTMMYTKAVSTSGKLNQMVRCADQKVLPVPPLGEPL